MSDPSDILPPSEIEAILCDYEARAAHVPMNTTERNVGRLLRHHAALTAPADGKALGRELWKAAPAIIPTAWEAIEPMWRDRYAAHAVALYQRGHAAGALSREGEIAALRSENDRLHRDHETVCREASADRRALEAAQAVCDDRKATIARLTAELAETRAVVESFQRNSGCVDGYTIGEALAKIGASLDRTPTEGIPDAIERLKREKATARADGAREERRLTVDDMLAVARDTHPLAQPAVHEAMSGLGKRIKDRPIGAADPSARGDR